MAQKTTEEMLDAIFDEINNTIMPADLSAGAPEPTAFVALAVPGTRVQPSTFDTSSPDGRKRLYTLLDRIPSFDKRYVDSGKTCSDMYRQILQAQPPVDDPQHAQALEEQYKTASATVKSLLKDYQDYQRAYNRARRIYLSLQNKDGVDEIDLADAEDDMRDAWQNWCVFGSKTRLKRRWASRAAICCARRLRSLVMRTRTSRTR